MKHGIATFVGILALLNLDACGNSEPASPGGTGGTLGSGGKTGAGGAVGTGGRTGTGGVVGAGGRTGSGGSSAAGTGGASGQTGCPYKVTSFSCEAACAKLNAFSAKCADDPTVPSDVKIMLSLYGEVPVVCTNTCAIVSPSSQAQWGCLQGVPDDAPCSAIGGCTATNCP